MPTTHAAHVVDHDDVALMDNARAEKALLLLHSSESVDLLLRIDSQSTTYL